MRSFAIFALAATALAAATTLNDIEVSMPMLDKRQSAAFGPNVTTATGDTCADAFGAGYVTCREKGTTRNRLCYNPSIGQQCCQSDWACPAGSYCSSVYAQCCPEGMDANTCAGIKPSTSSSVWSSTWSKTSSTASSTSSVYKHKNATEAHWTKVTSKVLAVTSTPCPKNETTTAPWGTWSSATATKTGIVKFTGAATVPQIAPAVVGFAGLVAALL